MNCDLILNLANSIWFVNHRNHDVLNDQQWINENLNQTNNLLETNLGSDFRESIKSIRKIIINVLEGEPIDKHFDYLNDCLKKSMFYNKLSIIDGKPEIELIPTTSYEDRLISDIIIELIESVNNGKVSKIRKCGVPDCQFFFLDQSKNQNKKYCSVKCNNVAKVRRFREKNKV